MSRVCIVALIGLPAAGKTTFSEWLLRHPQRHFNVLHFCFDDFLPKHSDPIEEFHLKTARAEILKHLESLVLSLQQTKTLPASLTHKLKTSRQSGDVENFLIICDDNNYYRSMRYPLFQLCRNFGISYAQIYFPCTLDLALERNAKRETNSRIPTHILEQMSTRLETPTANWEANTLTLNDTFDGDVVVNFLFDAFNCVPQPQVPVTKEQVTSTLHTLDVLLRRRVKELLSTECKSAAKQEKAIDLNAKRKQILQATKQRVHDGEQLDEEDLVTCVKLLH